MIFKKALTSIVILLLLLEMFVFFSPKTEAQEWLDPRYLQAEDLSRVQRIGGDYYVGDPDGQGWMEKDIPPPAQWGMPFGRVLFTLGQHNESLKFEFAGTGLIVCFYCHRSGIARVIIERKAVVEVNTTRDTYDSDGGFGFFTIAAEGSLPYTRHNVTIIATGDRNPASPAEYIYVDFFMLFPYTVNELPTAEILSITSAKTNMAGLFTRLEPLVFKGNGTDVETEYASLKFEWNFNRTATYEGTYGWSCYGNGTAVYAYEKAGEYKPKLKVTDSKGAFVEIEYGLVVKVNPLPPDLQISGSDITFSYSESNVIITAEVHNIGETESTSFTVEFRNENTSTSLGTQQLSPITEGSSQNATLMLTSLASGTIIKVMVDIDNATPEFNETNNEASTQFTGDAPTLKKITACKDSSKISDSDKGSFIGITNISLRTKFIADVNDANGISTVANVTFKLNGKEKSVDKTWNDGFYCEFDIGTDADVKIFPEINRLTAQANDTTGLVSNIQEIDFTMLRIPDWVLSMNVSGLLVCSFDTSTMTYKMEFSYDVMKKENATTSGSDDPVNKGKDNGISDFTIKFTVSYCMSTNIATISGGGELGLEVLGYAPKVEIKVTGEINSTNLALIKLAIDVTVEIELPTIPVAGISIPLPDWAGGDITLGVVIEGKITVEVNVTFTVKDGKLELSSASVTVEGTVEGKAALSIPFIAGGYAGVYGKIIFTAQTEKPHFNVTLEVGLMAGVWLDWKSWDWKRGWAKSFTTDPYYMNITEWENLPSGSDYTYGNSTIVDNLDREDSPFVASDSLGNTMAVWTSNQTLHTTQVYYSIWNGSAWGTPAAITNDSCYKMRPVLAYDSNNKAIVTWTQINKTFNSSSNVTDYYASTPNFEIFYSVWNDTHWTTPQPITNTTDTAMEYGPAIAADRFGKVMTVWTHDYDGNITTRADRDIFYSIWNGSAWSTPSAVTVLAESDIEPSVAYDSQGNAIVVWLHDNDSTTSTFDDLPPEINNATVAPDPVLLGNPVNITANVIEYMGLNRVYANITNPLGSNQTIDLVYDMNSRLYKGQYTPMATGAYTVQIIAEDSVNQTDMTLITFQGIASQPPPTVDWPPIVITADAIPNLLYIGDTITITAQVGDDRGILEVVAEVIRPGYSPEYLPLIGPYPTNGTYQNIYVNTYVPGTYTIHIRARDNAIPPNPFDVSSVFLVVRPRNINNEIYYATWNGTAWSNPAIVTNQNDFSESGRPSVAYEVNNRAIIVWTEFNGTSYKIYHCIMPGLATPKALPDPGGPWNLDPVVKTFPTGIAIVTWRAAPGDWGDLYYLIINSTRYIQTYDLVCALRRITKDKITDWKQTVTIDSGGNIIFVWLKHQATNIGNYTHPTMSVDDDDIYYTIIRVGPDLEIESSDIAFLPTTTTYPSVGDNVMINATIHNTGMFDLRDITVSSYDGNPSEGGMLIGSAPVPVLRIGENATCLIPWTATFGYHEIYVVVDPAKQIPENNEVNNKAFKRIVISTFVGSGVEDVHAYIGNASLTHSNTVSLVLGDIVEVVFNATGTNDNIITEGNAILPTIVNGEVTLVPIMPSINVTLNHDNPASLTISNSSVALTLGWLGVNDQIIIPSMPTTGNVVLNHTAPAYLLITNDTVGVTFTPSSINEAMLPWMDIYTKIKHSNTLTFTFQKVPDPKLGGTQNSIGKFIDLATLDSFEWALIKIYYREEDLQGMNESTLRMHYWNAVTHQWNSIADSGVNTVENYVWANVSHFTIFAPIALAHDIAIVNVLPSKNMVGQGYTMYINVTIANTGGSTETFNVTAYADTTIIQTKTVTLSAGNSATITFTWNTTGFARDNYTISAYAWPVLGEMHTDDNTVINGTVLVGVPCDVTSSVSGVPDGVCNMRDIGYFCSKFGTTPSSLDWDPNCDVTGPDWGVPDNIVNMRDIGEACSNFMKP